MPTQVYTVRSFSPLRALLLAMTVASAANYATAQSSSTYSEYSAKFVCGVPTSSQISQGRIENAEYSTSINIHNPNIFSSDASLSFLKKAVVVHSEGSPLTPPSAFKQDSLPNDYGETITCATIRSLLGSAAPAAPAFIDGFFVVIVPPASTPNELDLTAVYTSSNNGPITLDVVPIQGRIITPPPTGAAAIEGAMGK
jgi:hypothetical protein